MSKTIGNVIDPFELIEKYGADPIRYYFLAKFSPFSDGDFSENKFIEVYNADLANGLGNLVSRLAKLCEQNDVQPSTITPRVPESAEQGGFTEHIEDFEFNLALEEIWREIKTLDVEINQRKPWGLEKESAAPLLTKFTRDLRNIAFMLRPFLPETAEKIEKQFKGPKIKSEKPLFPRL